MKDQKLGRIYTVESTEVGNCHPNVFIREVAGIAFNSVQFARVSAGEKV